MSSSTGRHFCFLRKGLYMADITLNAYAKINLSLEIVRKREDGYHDIDSIMQGVDLCDIITTRDAAEGRRICDFEGLALYMDSNSTEMPYDESNLVIKGLKAVITSLANRCKLPAAVSVYVDKRLPVAAGIAGGSGNAAGAMLGLNALLGNPLSLEALMNAGTKVGADVPFSLMMNAARNRELLHELEGIDRASVAARTTGIGDIIEPTEPVKKAIIMANPGVGVSTRDVYEAIDSDADRVVNRELYFNRMEEYTLSHYEAASAIKNAMIDNLRAEMVLMSGSGPTMVAYYSDAVAAEEDYANIESWLKPGWRAWLSRTGEE